MTFAAFLAAGVALFCAGFLTGLCINRNDARRIPDHPSIRRTTTQRRLRVIEGGTPRPFNWAEEQ